MPLARRPLRAAAGALTAAALALVALVGASGDAGSPATAGNAPAPARTAPAEPTATAARSVRPRRAVPSAVGLAAARRYARARRGTVAFAVVGTDGRVRCRACDRVFRSASTAKTLLLVAHLRAARGALPAGEVRLLDRMIRVSDNPAADVVYARVGDPGLARLARRAGLRDFAPGGFWAETRTSARDQARLFARLPALVPRRHRALARRLLRTVAPEQSWGVPRASRPRGWRTLHKAGWRPSPTGALVHQGARLERGGRTVAVAVLTDGSPNHGYGSATVEGVARRLLAAGAGGS